MTSCAGPIMSLLLSALYLPHGTRYYYTGPALTYARHARSTLDFSVPSV
jgi:hypothetical protein